jgi:hypothetical protein
MQYEHIPHFCFSCGRLGHSELFCPTPGTRDADGSWPFGAGLRAPDERKKSGSNENPSREQFASQNSKRESKSSSTAGNARNDVTSPNKYTGGIKRKGDGTKQVYRKVNTLLPSEPANGDPNASNQLVVFSEQQVARESGEQQTDFTSEGDSNKKRKTSSISENSAEAVRQPCPSQ